MIDDPSIMCGEHQYFTEYSCITYSYNNKDSIHIDRVYTDSKHRGKGHFKKAIANFLRDVKSSSVTASILPDRLPNGEYNHQIEDAIIRTLKSFGFVPEVFDGESYNCDLVLNR